MNLIFLSPEWETPKPGPLLEPIWPVSHNYLQTGQEVFKKKKHHLFGFEVEDTNCYNMCCWQHREELSSQPRPGHSAPHRPGSRREKRTHLDTFLQETGSRIATLLRAGRSPAQEMRAVDERSLRGGLASASSSGDQKEVGSRSGAWEGGIAMLQKATPKLEA